MKEILFKKQDDLWIVSIDGKATMKNKKLPLAMKIILKWITKEIER